MVLLIPYIDEDKVRQARAWLAEVQGYARQAAPVALLFPTTQVSQEQWKHFAAHDDVSFALKDGSSSWSTMEVPPRSEWVTLLVYGESCYLFNRAGATCYFPERAVADRTLFRGTVLAGDYTSELVGGKLVYTFRALHALVSRGMLLVGLPLHLRMQAAQRAISGLRNLEAGSIAWRHDMAVVRRTRQGARRAALLQPGCRLVHAEETPDMSNLWAIESV